MKAAHQLQDKVMTSQADKGVFEIPNWNKEDVEQMRATINVVGVTVKDSSKMFGRTENMDPVYWMRGAAMGWSGLPAFLILLLPCITAAAVASLAWSFGATSERRRTPIF